MWEIRNIKGFVVIGNYEVQSKDQRVGISVEHGCLEK